MTYEGNNDGQISDIDKWVVSLERSLEDVPQYMCEQLHTGRISRIPQNLLEIDSKVYEPYFIWIGPYHHGKPILQRIEVEKPLVLKYVLKKRDDLKIRHYLKVIRSNESAARSFYTDVDMECENLVQMLLLDSLYILTMFCGMVQRRENMNQSNTCVRSRSDNGNGNKCENQLHEEMRTWNDNVAQVLGVTGESIVEMTGENELPRWFWALFVHNIFLLENQLPFIILEKMFSLAYGGSKTQLIDILKARADVLPSGYTNLDPNMMIFPTQEIHHLLQLCHMIFSATLRHESTACELTESSQMYRLGSAGQLYEAGVSFEARSGSSQHCLLDITLGGSGNMSMPYLHVGDNTISLLRNLITIEQMKYPSLGLNVSGYAVLLLHLITFPNDVELLKRKGIIRHHMSSDKEKMYLVNELIVGLAFEYVEDKYSLKPLFQGLK